MQCVIESPGLQLDKKVGDLVQSKFKALEKIYDRVTNCLVVVRKENDDHKKDFQVKAQLAVPKKALYAHGQAETFEIALHKVVDNLAHQLQRYKRYKNEREEIW